MGEHAAGVPGWEGSYGDDTYLRLAEIKAKYDPENVFHNNKNVKPAVRGT